MLGHGGDDAAAVFLGYPMTETFHMPSSPDRRRVPSADLGEGLEDLLDVVWRAEREWDLDDRIDLGWRLQQQKRHQRLAVTPVPYAAPPRS